MKKSSTSATANKKRKLPLHDDDDDDDDEEENMEKFYALINSIREARDRSIVNKVAAAPAQDQSETKTRKVVEEDDQEKLVSARKPSFQREDFMEGQAKLKNLPCLSLGSSSQSKEGVGVDDDNDRKEEVKEELDLNLSL